VSARAEDVHVAGFCQGGGFALIAGTQPGFRAAAVNYGDVPKDRSRLDGVCPVVASYGAKDRLFGRRAAERLERHLTALGVPADVKTYDRAGHSSSPRSKGGRDGSRGCRRRWPPAMTRLRPAMRGGGSSRSSPSTCGEEVSELMRET
jgi:dienelactone hydrolase